MSAQTLQVKNRAIPEWSFGDRVRKIRRDTFEMEQQEFADLIGVSKVTYGQWETGGRKPRDLVNVANQIERMAGVPGLASWLLGVTVTQQPTVPKRRPSRPVGRTDSTRPRTPRRRPPAPRGQSATRPPQIHSSFIPSAA